MPAVPRMSLLETNLPEKDSEYNTAHEKLMRCRDKRAATVKERSNQCERLFDHFLTVAARKVFHIPSELTFRARRVAGASVVEGGWHLQA